MLVSAVQQSASAIHVHISSPLGPSHPLTKSHPSRSSQSAELSEFVEMAFGLCFLASLLGILTLQHTMGGEVKAIRMSWVDTVRPVCHRKTLLISTITIKSLLNS